MGRLSCVLFHNGQHQVPTEHEVTLGGFSMPPLLPAFCTNNTMQPVVMLSSCQFLRVTLPFHGQTHYRRSYPHSRTLLAGHWSALGFPSCTLDHARKYLQQPAWRWLVGSAHDGEHGEVSTEASILCTLRPFGGAQTGIGYAVAGLVALCLANR